MSWVVTAIVASTVITASGQIKQGKDALAQAERDKKQYDLDAQLSEVETKQLSNKRIADYQDATSSNEAWFSYLGRDIQEDRSVNAFFKKQEQIAVEDVVRNELQGRFSATRIRNVGADVLTAGYNARTAGYINAAATVFGSVSSISKTRAPTTTNSVSSNTRIIAGKTASQRAREQKMYGI
jgi:hypothetical protein